MMLQHPQGQLTMLQCPTRGTGGGTAQAPHPASYILDAGSAIAACPVGSALVFSQNSKTAGASLVCPSSSKTGPQPGLQNCLSLTGPSLQLHPDPQPGLPNCWSLAGPFLRSHPGHPPGFLFGWSLTRWRPFGEGVVSGFCNFGLFYSWFCDRALILPSLSFFLAPLSVSFVFCFAFP